jgi:iron-sulfur cluster repair protein YtfE (RIC family)
MLHSIGKKSAPADLVDMLLECHGRIRKFSALAVAIAERTDLPRDELAEACGQVERYFTVALPLHVRDEEESVLPRLRGRSAEVDAALARMHDEHVEHGPALERMLAGLKTPRELHAPATALQAMFESHLRQEEQVLFPAIRALPVAEQAAIVNELRARRG